MADRNDFPNGHLLWTPQQLNERLGASELAILDLRPTHEVMQGIIPGAAHLDLYGIGLVRMTPAEFATEWANLMRSLLGMRGAGDDAVIVLYESNSGMRSARAFWILEYFGHENVHVLDGGMQAWQKAGYPMVKDMNPPRPRRFTGNPRPELLTSADELHQRLSNDPDLVVLDTRSDDEYFGRNTRGGPRGGTIPGAVHLEWLAYLDEEGRFKPPAQLLSLFEANGVLRDKAIVPF